MFTVECIEERWYVCRGELIVSPGYLHKGHAERELVLKQQEEYRILVSIEGGYHPQWRWSKEWSWAHFKQKTTNAYVICETLKEAERFMAEQDITQYDTVQEQRSIL